MRQVGTIEDHAQVQRLAAYLESQGIACTVEDSAAGGYTIWVHEEDQVAAAREELARFREDPDNARYREARPKSAAVAAPAPRPRSQTIDLRDRWARPAMERGPVTFGLMALMILVAVFTGLNPARHEELLWKLVISPDRTLNAVFSGEFWRLVSPIFLHFGPLHFIFNLIYLRDFGLMVEDRIGTPRFLGLVLAVAILSNYAQFRFTGPMFGGMSGVNYGLFGFAWVRGRLDPNSGFWVPPNTVVILLGWHVLCVMGVVEGVANWAHGIGLAVGVVLGASRPLLRGLR